MSDQDVNTPTEAELTEARGLGWADKDQWRGDPSQWVDAKTFLEKGRHILPILKQRNEKLEAELAATRGQMSSIESSLKSANAAIEALQEAHEDDVKEQVAAARADLRAELAKASREGDHEGVAELTDKLTQLNATEAADKDKADKGDKGGKTDDKPAEWHPEVTAWYKANPQYITDGRRAALAQAVAIELRQKGDKSIGSAFMDAVAAEVEKTFGGQVRQPKVDGGNGGGGRTGSGGGGANGKSYADLPADAKATCERQASRLVGPNRKHKTIDSWRASYAATYFSQE